MDPDPFADLIDKWEWMKDGTGIELCSNNPQGADRKRDRRAGLQGANVKGNRTVKRGKSGLLKKGGQGQLNTNKVGKAASNKRTSTTPDQKYVTLHNLKEATLSELEKRIEASDWFLGIMETEQFDQFLKCLLNYFHWFLEKKVKEEKPRTMYLEPSARELAEREALTEEVNKALQKLGFAYSIILLGIGTSQFHHMGSGSLRVSMVYKDREKSECLYEYSSIIVWIAFRQKHREAIGKEIGRLFRSNTFNPAIRKNIANEGQNEANKETKEEKISLSEYKRRNKNQQSAKTMSVQQCPVISSILPTPKDRSPWLFKKLDLEAFPKPVTKENNISIEDFRIDFNELRLGIIGEPLSQFDGTTLKPVGQEIEDDDNADVTTDQIQIATYQKSSAFNKESSIANSVNKNTHPIQEPLSRETTALSQLTVEAESEQE